MVFTTAVALVRVRGPDTFWKRHQFWKMAAQFYGKRRNCFSITVRAVYRALQYATNGRTVKKIDRKALWNTRLHGACIELGTDYVTVMNGLSQCNVALNRKVLSELAVWEPRTFKCLADLGTVALQLDPPYEGHTSTLRPQCKTVHTKGLKYD